MGRQRTVCFTGETWLLGALSPATAVSFGRGCGSGVAPILTCATPYLGNPMFRLEALVAPAALPCLFGLATTTQSLPIGPCTLYLGPWTVALPAISNWAGFAETPLPLPGDRGLRGTVLHAQAFVADPRVSSLGVAFSQGRRLVLGD